MLHPGASVMNSRLSGSQLLALEESSLARNYNPLPVVATKAKGPFVWDSSGKRYLDFLAAYSAVNFGHSNPRLIRAARAQLRRVTLTSRAFHHDKLGQFASALAELLSMEMVLPMNSGAEAVESAIKIARAWGYRVKGVKKNRANIVVAEGNFHGRTISIVSFSTDLLSTKDFGPFTPGFTKVEYGNIEQIASAINDETVAVLLEPIQGEAGVITPPAGYLGAVRKLTSERNVLLIMDEIQSGLGRTGATVQCDNEGVIPDLFILGKALGGGIVPVSAVVGKSEVMGVLKPGEHGSTFGGNPLASAVGLAVVRLLARGKMQKKSERLGKHFHKRLNALVGRGIVEVRGVGLWAGLDIDPQLGTGREICEELSRRGVLAKDTQGSTIRLAPPLVISKKQLDWGIDQLSAVLDELRKN